MATLEIWINRVDQALMGGGMVALLLGIGVCFSVRSGFFQLRGIPYIWKRTAGTLLKKDPPPSGGKAGGISPFQAMTTALAGTMGVGNIAGVATALVSGGPGAIFWMWVSGFFGMMTKYAEIYLAVKYRRRGSSGAYYGGPMYYMEDGLGSKALAKAFALLCALSSLGIGCMTQVNSAAAAMENAFRVPLWVSGLAIAAALSLVVFGGIRRIAAVTSMVIPFASILYLFCAGTILVLHRENLPEAVRLIMAEAFATRSAAGGVAGYGMSRALRLGLSRGVFTNEAGLGSAPIAHASADCKTPEQQAVWGVFEVFLDTIVVCTVTALAILVAGGGALWKGGLDGAELTSAAFADSFGRFGHGFVALSILLYAVAGMLGWCFYGESALRYLEAGRGRAVTTYRLVFLVCAVVGATLSLQAVWRLSDWLNALMALPNVAALFLLRKEVFGQKNRAFRSYRRTDKATLGRETSQSHI